MAKRGGYRSDKRRKELDRLKKQEEKRLRRFGKGREGENTGDQEQDGSPEEKETEEEG